MDESVIAEMPSSDTAFEMEGAVVVIARVLNKIFWRDALRLSAAGCKGLLLLLLLEDRALHMHNVVGAHIMKVKKIHR